MTTLKQVPDPEQIMVASNNLIIDQGVAVFSVVVFAIVIFGMMGLMFMMQRQTGAMLRQMGKESSQQDKLITENNLNRVAAQRNTDELIDVKQLLARLIDLQTQGTNDKNEIIESGIASIDQNTEGVSIMKSELEKVLSEMAAMRQDMRELVDTVNQATSEIKTTVISKTTEYETRMKQVEDSVKKIADETTAETEKVEDIPLKPSGVPVTPKPVETQSANLYKENPKEETK